MNNNSKFPDIVDVEFTAYCNLTCGFCFGPVDDRSIPNLPTSFWMDALRLIKTCGAHGIVVSGGEPTIHPDIVPLLSHAKDLGLSVVMSTHGQIRRKVLECAPYTDWIALPVDGITKDMLITMRGRPWDINQAKLLIEELKECNPQIKIKLGTVATKKNLNEVPQIGIEAYDKNLEIDTWKVYQYTARRKFKNRADEFSISDQQYFLLRDKVLSLLKNPPFQVVFSSNKSRKRAYVFIYPDGTVAIPNIGKKMGDIVIGNLYQEGKRVLDRVTGIDLERHGSNYNSTYTKKS